MAGPPRADAVVIAAFTSPALRAVDAFIAALISNDMVDSAEGSARNYVSEDSIWKRRIRSKPTNVNLLGDQGGVISLTHRRRYDALATKDKILDVVCPKSLKEGLPYDIKQTFSSALVQRNKEQHSPSPSVTTIVLVGQVSTTGRRRKHGISWAQGSSPYCLEQAKFSRYSRNQGTMCVQRWAQTGQNK